MIADIGTIVEVTPWDEIWVKTSSAPAENIDDKTPFRFRVEGWLWDGQIFYGLHGPVVSGPTRYRDLICNVFVRAEGTDWRKEVESQAGEGQACQ